MKAVLLDVYLTPLISMTSLINIMLISFFASFIPALVETSSTFFLTIYLSLAFALSNARITFFALSLSSCVRVFLAPSVP